jgi:hypothetical protein
VDPIASRTPNSRVRALTGNARTPATHHSYVRAVGFSRLLDRRPGRKVKDMKLAFELPPAQADRLKQEAARLGVAPDELARAALADLLANHATDFEAAARRVLDKHRELYRRLA